MKPYVYLSAERSRYLKSMLINAGLNIGSAAIAMGMSRPSLSSRINGKIDFTRTEMEKFALLVNERPAAIFFAA